MDNNTGEILEKIENATVEELDGQLSMLNENYDFNDDNNYSESVAHIFNNKYRELTGHDHPNYAKLFVTTSDSSSDGENNDTTEGTDSGNNDTGTSEGGQVNSIEEEMESVEEEPTVEEPVEEKEEETVELPFGPVVNKNDIRDSYNESIENEEPIVVPLAAVEGIEQETEAKQEETSQVEEQVENEEPIVVPLAAVEEMEQETEVKQEEAPQVEEQVENEEPIVVPLAAVEEMEQETEVKQEEAPQVEEQVENEEPIVVPLAAVEEMEQETEVKQEEAPQVEEQVENEEPIVVPLAAVEEMEQETEVKQEETPQVEEQVEKEEPIVVPLAAVEEMEQETEVKQEEAPQVEQSAPVEVSKQGDSAEQPTQHETPIDWNKMVRDIAKSVEIKAKQEQAANQVRIPGLSYAFDNPDGVKVFTAEPGLNINNIAHLVAGKRYWIKFSGFTLGCESNITKEDIINAYNELKNSAKLGTQQEISKPVQKKSEQQENKEILLGRISQLERIIKVMGTDDSTLKYINDIKDAAQMNANGELFKEFVVVRQKVMNDAEQIIVQKLGSIFAVRYALDDRTYNALSDAYSDFAEAKITDAKADAIDRFAVLYEKICKELEEKEIFVEGKLNISNDTRPSIVRKITGDRVKNFATEMVAISYTIDEITSLTNQYMHTQNSTERKKLMDQINAKLDDVNSTNRRVNSLAKKDGKIKGHQQAVKAKVTSIKEVLNSFTIQTGISDFVLADKLNNLAIAYRANEVANNRKTRKQVKNAEKDLFGHKLTSRRKKHLNDLLEKREKEIEKMQSKEYEKNKDIQNAYRSGLKKLKGYDKQILGKDTTEDIYDELLKRSSYLVGGTKIVLPVSIVELTSTIKSAMR